MILIFLYLVVSFLFFHWKDSISDCYINPSESIQTRNDINYVQSNQVKPPVFEIPVIDCRRGRHVLDYKSIDHRRTIALREAIEQRTQKR